MPKLSEKAKQVKIKALQSEQVKLDTKLTAHWRKVDKIANENAKKADKIASKINAKISNIEHKINKLNGKLTT